MATRLGVPRLKRAAVVATAAATLGACANATPVHGPLAEPSPDYVFTQVRIGHVEAEGATVAEVTWRTSWASDVFPGVRSCVWTVFAADGSVIGTHKDTFVSLDPRDQEATASVSVSAAAASANIACSDERLDSGGTYAYGFSNIKPQVPDTEGRPWAISFDATWLGDAYPGVVTCHAQLLDKSGGTLVDELVNIFVGEGDIAGGQAVLSSDLSDVPKDSVAEAAVVSCAPFSG
jgi:hypothetical protein